jgi:transcriptional regulator
MFEADFMYQPAHQKFIENRPEVLHALIREYPLGTLISQRDRDIDIDHTPFFLDSTAAKLSAHLPRTNSVWQGLDGKPVQIVFHGPDAYITPSWYVAKQEHGKVVPTWNYVIVIARGTARIHDDKAWLRAHLDELTDEHERTFSHPWKVSDAPADYLDKMLGALVGLEIDTLQLEGKFKLSQNRPPADRQRVIEGLTEQNSPLVRFIS